MPVERPNLPVEQDNSGETIEIPAERA